MYPSLFIRAFEFVYRHECGYSNHKADKGGKTNHGVTLRTLQNLNIDIDGDGEISGTDILKMTKSQAKAIYFESYWVPSKIAMLIDDRLVFKLFDMAINQGVVGSIKRFQRALNTILDLTEQLKVDGCIGGRTLGAVSKVKEKEALNSFLVYLTKFYHKLAEQPGQKVFLKGWLRRVNDMDFNCEKDW